MTMRCTSAKLKRPETSQVPRRDHFLKAASIRSRARVSAWAPSTTWDCRVKPLEPTTLATTSLPNLLAYSLFLNRSRERLRVVSRPAAISSLAVCEGDFQLAVRRSAMAASKLRVALMTAMLRGLMRGWGAGFLRGQKRSIRAISEPH